MKKSRGQMPATKDDLEEMGAHIITAINKTLEDYATKDDIHRLEGKVDNVSTDTSGLRNRVIDLEMKHAAPHSHNS